MLKGVNVNGWALSRSRSSVREGKVAGFTKFLRTIYDWRMYQPFVGGRQLLEFREPFELLY